MAKKNVLYEKNEKMILDPFLLMLRGNRQRLLRSLTILPSELILFSLVILKASIFEEYQDRTDPDW